MHGSRTDSTNAVYPWLAVDDFVADAVSASALASALELGLIDALAEPRPADVGTLADALRLEVSSLGLLLDLLHRDAVVERDGRRVSLSDRFRAVLPFRDLLECRLEFARLVWPDVQDRFTQLLTDLPAFMAGSATFELFRYDRCFVSSAENLARTRRWMRFTTTLTRYEAEACLDHCDLSKHRRVLDVGGNSGELALRLCRRYPGISATVFDLPVVCEVGEAHVAAQPETDRIRFVRGDARRDPLPPGNDLVTLKSFLHDWPEHDAETMLSRAAGALAPGGALLIFERGPMRLRDRPLSFAMIPDLVFNRFYRGPEPYRRWLSERGFDAIEVQEIDLNTPFFLLLATRPG